MAEKSLMAGNHQKPKMTMSLVTGVSMAVFGSAFQFGYNIAVMNAPAKEILDEFFPCAAPIEVVLKETATEMPTITEAITEATNASDVAVMNTTAAQLTTTLAPKIQCTPSEKEYRDNMYALAVAAFPFAGMFGSLMVAAVVGKFGRRGGLMLNNVISLIAALCLGLAKTVGSYPLIVIGRAIIGIFAGLATGIVPMYISEISPKEWRGAIGVLNQLLITIGILVAQILGLQDLLGNDLMWPVLFALTFLPSFLQAVSYPFMPSSPRYLLIDCHKEDAARNVLTRLRGTDDVSGEMDEMRSEAESASKTKALTLMQLIGERSVRWQLITIIAMMIAQQLSGINAVFFYTNKIFSAAGIPEGNPQDLASVVVGSVNVLMTIVSVVVIEKAGRKKLLVGGFAVMIFWCLALTIVLTILLGYEDPTQAGPLPYLSIACVIGYIIGFAVGPGPIPWLIASEFFTQAARPAATTISCIVNWLCNFIIGMSFPSIANATGAYVFLIFMGVCVVITLYLYFIMPETKGKTFGEINAMFAVRNGVSVGGVDSGLNVPLKPMNSRADEL